MSPCSNAVERTVRSGSGGSIGNQLFHSAWPEATPQTRSLHQAHARPHTHTIANTALTFAQSSLDTSPTKATHLTYQSSKFESVEMR